MPRLAAQTESDETVSFSRLPQEKEGGGGGGGGARMNPKKWQLCRKYVSFLNSQNGLLCLCEEFAYYLPYAYICFHVSVGTRLPYVDKRKSLWRKQFNLMLKIWSKGSGNVQVEWFLNFRSSTSHKVHTQQPKIINNSIIIKNYIIIISLNLASLHVFLQVIHACSDSMFHQLVLRNHWVRSSV